MARDDVHTAAQPAQHNSHTAMHTHPRAMVEVRCNRYRYLLAVCQ